ncbi:tRNA pseudouridine(55) synthase TruB [Ruminococcus sp. FC2018]|uniref:tRNA pseudouridine(55) synthase TruB n=1 Tax=Ruminococcus sp. FC2018 TaxID=1410617 RepID=UPI000684248D|nr:tRNA pseudouridine(55) synthase TruB [Ruminococcus sp. FC2018]
MSASDNNIMGILPVNKPKGWTSFDVVAKLRGVLKIKRLGHAGTLDPMAEGVLPVFVGKATKACDILPDTKKVYTAGFRLGVTTDTLDITGKVLSEDAGDVTAQQLEKVREQFVGEITQLPPMYSAVKVDGKRLYQLAREGKTAQRTPRKCLVHSIEIILYDEKTREGEMTISCEKGTYVRTIIDDMGSAIGTGAVMTSLVRTYSGGFDIKDCLTIEQIEDICARGRLSEAMMPVEKAFEMYGEIHLDRRLTGLYKNGVKLYRRQVKTDTPAENTFRVFGSEGSFLGLAAFKDDMLTSVKNFY